MIQTLRALRIARFTIILGLLVVAAGCLSSTEAKPSISNLSGSWSYTGAQTSPVRENLSGTLTISSESGSSFQGRLDVVGLNPQTQQNRVLGGTVTGSAQGSDLIDFDANLETAPRRHVGQIVADTITGTWVGSSADGTTASGTFRIEKTR
ncbi:MAG: hypothetical protein ABR585_05950 [Gemmatimonadaceae bacterium]